MAIFLSILVGAACLVLIACTILNQPRFGKQPQGDRLERVKQSPHYQNGEFQYPIPTPLFSQDVGMVSVIWSNLFNKSERLVPDTPVPVVKTDLKALDSREDTLVWLGHSSWFVQLGGKRILIDPVLSDYAAPFSFFNKAYEGTSIYRADDIPEIDCLLISHDHWDHLDYQTVVALKSKVKQVICPLGVGADFDHWGYSKEMIREGDWYDKIPLGDGITIHVLPARHYSGRLFSKNQTLWVGFALETPVRKIFYSGDSGYGPHFLKIGEMFQGFDLVLLDCGQYDPRWAYIHMTPEEAAQAAADLEARALLPTHVGRFTIANHPWDAPFKHLAVASQAQSYRLLTPKIGEPVLPGDTASRFLNWWEN